VINYNLKQETFIDKYFRLGPPSPKGWRQNNAGCPYCHDGRSKNPRSHFLFINDEIGFQCFNCGGKHRFTGNNINTLATFISKSAWKKVGALLLEIKKDKLFPTTSLKDQDDIKDEVGEEALDLINYKEVELPDVSIRLNTKKEKVAPRYRQKFINNKIKVKEYLKSNGLDVDIYKQELYICMEGDFANRLIFPIYFDGKLISWAARALFPTKTKYLYPPSTDDFNNRGIVIYGLDNLFKSENVKQIFVTESINDAIHFNGIAILSKNMTQEQINILKYFNFHKKKLIFVLDNDTITKWDNDLKGGELGKIILKQNITEWSVSQPNFGRNIKDISNSMVKNGWLETYDKIMMSNVTDQKEMEMKIKLKSVEFGRKKWEQG